LDTAPNGWLPTIAHARCRASGDVPGDVPLVVDALEGTRGSSAPTPTDRQALAADVQRAIQVRPTEQESRRRRKQPPRRASQRVRQARRVDVGDPNPHSSRVVAIARIAELADCGHPRSLDRRDRPPPGGHDRIEGQRRLRIAVEDQPEGAPKLVGPSGRRSAAFSAPMTSSDPGHRASPCRRRSWWPTSSCP
jgi:hypothetical protein